MKKIISIIFLFVIAGSILAQDTTNFYTITAKWDNYFDSIIEIRGIDSMQGTGYNPYMRKVDYWEQILFPHGDFSVWEQGITNHLYDFIENGDNSTDALTWKCIGPDKMPEDGTIMNSGNNENSIKGLGQIHYIAFDPTDNSYQKMFACSPAGGLWVSNNGGESWTNGGTDLGLFFSGVSSIAIDEAEPDDNWFVTTGCAEGMPGHLWWQRAIGVWRTTNAGVNWDYIGLNETPEESKIQQMRKIISVPTDMGKAHLFVVTNKGLFECENALVSNPVWTQICSGNFYDIEVDPDPSSKIIYASGTDFTTIKVINYENTPTTCSALNNLDFLPDPTEYETDRRITIEISPAEPNYLFIVVSYNFMWYEDPNDAWNSNLFRYDLESDNWVDKGPLPIQKGATVCNAGVNPERGMGWAVSPVHNNGGELWMAHGNTAPIRGASNLLDNNGCVWNLLTSEEYFDMEVHVDQHYMKMIPVGENLELWVGNDGGVYKTVLDQIGPSETYDWQEMNNGLAVATVYHISTSELDQNTLLSGQHDNGSNIYELGGDGIWSERHVASGDGFKPDMDNSNAQNMYVSKQYATLMHSEDGGANFNKFLPQPGSTPNWTTYLTLNPGNQSEIFVNGTDLDREDINWNSDKWGLKKFTNGQWHRWEEFETQIQIVEDTDYDDPSTWKLEISESDPDIIYVVWRGGMNDDPRINLRVFKSSTGGGTGLSDWVDLGEPQEMNGWLTDIAIDYDDPDKFYVSCKNKILFCNSTEPANPIWTLYKTFDQAVDHGYYINSLAFVKGSTDKSLYVGTNYGMYYINENLEDFVNVNGNLPHADVKDIEINYNKKTIAVGTFGRGVWEADLPCDYVPVPEVITGTVYYNEEHHVHSDIEINDGGRLVITGNMYMGEGRSIIVKRGGLLILDGGTISNECAGMWQGIQVWGDPTKTHSYPDQGKVLIRNEGRIEMAKYAIRTVKAVGSGSEETEEIDLKYSGGIVNAVDAEFNNNYYSVMFYKYPAKGYTYESSNFINASEFSIDINYPAEEGENTFVYMSEINPIRLTANNYLNNSDFYHYGTGIKSFNATFFVEGLCLNGNPCEEWENGEFFNLDYGIYSTASSSLPYTDVRHTKFNDNYHGIYCGSLSNPRITSNEFFFYNNIPIDSWGLYLDFSTGYKVEENEFKNAFGALYWGTGIIINESREPLNEIYNNYFERLYISTSAQNCNRSILQQDGLKILCNDYVFNQRDIYVTADPGCILPGISINQGAPGETDLQAGNTFSWHNFYPMGPEYSDYENIINSDIAYYHHDLEQNPGEYHIVPNYYTSSTINLWEQPNPYNPELSCPSNISSGGGGNPGGDQREGMADNENKADSVQSILTALVDGGNTELLEQEVLQSMPPETYEVYLSLMGKSPYLSDSVLIAALEKEDVLPNVLIKDILVANPHAAKSEEVMEKVDEKSQPFTQEMLAEILLGKYLVAAKEKLEAQLGMYRHKRAMALNNLKRHYLSDTLNPSSIDSLSLLLEQETGLHEKYELVFTYIQNNQWTDAMYSFEGIPAQLSLDAQQQELYSDLSNFIEVLEELHLADTGFYGLNQFHKQTLLDLADNQNTKAGAYARNIMVYLGEYNYTPPVLLPENEQKSGYAFETKKPNVKAFSKVKVYPNPANDYVVIDLLSGNVDGAYVDFYDMQGRLVKSFEIPGRKQQQVISMKNIPAGVYLIRVNQAGITVGVEKLTINR